MTIKAVLFDLDGTLIDTAPDFIRIIRAMCEKHEHPAPTDAAIREQVSAGARAMVRLMFGDVLADVVDTDEQLLAYRQEFLDLYEQDICVDSRLFDGLDNLLKNLENQGIAWGIVTNKPRYLAENLLDKLDLAKRCAVLVCPDDVVNTKPDPEPMFLACSQLDIDPKRVIYIGDHVRDIEAGRSAGMTTVVAGFGYIVPDENPQDWGADVLVETPHELSEWVLSALTN